MEVNNNIVITPDDFKNVYTALLLKRRYEDKASRIESGSFLRRFFRRPSDPFKDLSENSLRLLANDAFKAAFPQLNMQRVTSDGVRESMNTDFVPFLSDASLRASVVQDVDGVKTARNEYFFFEEGEGFVHSYQRSQNKAQDGRNRYYAWSQSLSSRLHSDGFVAFYRALDSVCVMDQLRHLESNDSSMKTLRSSVDKVIAYLSLREEEINKLIDYRMELKGLNVDFASDVVKCQLGLLGVRSVESDYNDFHNAYLIDAFDVLSEKMSSVNALYVYENERLKAEGMSERPGLDEILEKFSRLSVGLSSSVKFPLDCAKWRLDAFTSAALDAGYSVKEIKAFVDRDCINREFSVPSWDYSYRPSYEVIHEKKADAYLTVVLEQTSTAFGKGVRNAADIDVRTPYSSFKETMSSVDDDLACQEFLSSRWSAARYSSFESLPFAISDEGNVLFSLDLSGMESLGRMLYTEASGILPETMSRFCKVGDLSMVRGYNEAFAEDFSSRLKSEGFDIFPSDGAGAFAKTVADTFVYLADRDPQLAGGFLREVGVLPNPVGDKGARDAVVFAASKMYGTGDVSCAERVKDFSCRWEQYINEARTAGLNSLSRAVRKDNDLKPKGLKL